MSTIHDYMNSFGNGVWTWHGVVRHDGTENGHVGPRRAVALVVVVATATAMTTDTPGDEPRDVGVDVAVDAHCV